MSYVFFENSVWHPNDTLYRALNLKILFRFRQPADGEKSAFFVLSTNRSRRIDESYAQRFFPPTDTVDDNISVFNGITDCAESCKNYNTNMLNAWRVTSAYCAYCVLNSLPYISSAVELIYTRKRHCGRRHYGAMIMCRQRTY